MPSFTLVDRITRFRRSPGVNWQKDIVVLARRGEKELWWVPGSTLYSRPPFLSTFMPGILMVVSHAEKRWRGHDYNSYTVHEGGRSSKKIFLGHENQINDFFGCAVADKLNTRKTLIIED